MEMKTAAGAGSGSVTVRLAGGSEAVWEMSGRTGRDDEGTAWGVPRGARSRDWSACTVPAGLCRAAAPPVLCSVCCAVCTRWHPEASRRGHGTAAAVDSVKARCVCRRACGRISSRCLALALAGARQGLASA